MPGSGKKRTRKDEEEENASKKKPKSRDDRTKSPKRAAAGGGTPALAASPATARKSSAQKPAPAPRVATKKKLQVEDTLGNPYEDSRATARKAKKKQDAPPKRKVAEPVVAPADTESTLMNGKAVGSANIDVPLVKKSRNPTSIPCILLFLVAILMWCTVALLGLLLSERMDHELQIFTLRDMLHNSESVQVPPPPKVEELEKNVRFWKGRAQQLESQKKGMLQEFGEKIANLEYME